MEATQPSGLFAVNPKEFLIRKNYDERAKSQKKKRGKKKVKKAQKQPDVSYSTICPTFLYIFYFNEIKFILTKTN